ncbi:MAG TPA: ATP-dependent helicase [Caldimonas sp.]|nr:ATP-dependent helicase [Caldimonas sp.]HEX4234387.1 ATP-dependent helicase [Caldimonas sp.]
MPAPRSPSASRAGLLGSLNEAQRCAAGFGIDDGTPCEAIAPLLVVAGAGSGKTLTLAARVARLVLAGADPTRLLLLTFSRRAALEMERRVGRVLHDALGLSSLQPPPRLPWCGTFHSVGARLLRGVAAQVGLDPSFTVDDRADSEDLLHLLRQRLGLGSGARRFPQKGTCLAIYSRAVNSRTPLADVLGETFPWCSNHAEALGRLFAAYVGEKQAQRVLDFDDLLVWWAEAMADAGIGAALRARFDHVLVDEYQDTNRLQAAIVRALKPDGRGLTVVGDDAQSIYSFRAADVRNILDFAGQFDPPASVLTLEQNYRATAPLLAASNAVIALAAERHVKQLWSERSASARPALVWVDDEAAEAAWVAERVLALRESGLALKSQAVLFRSGNHSNALELELARRDIPFVKYGGLKFLDSAHVKDVLAVLRFAANPHGQRAALRALQLVPGIGAASAARLLAALAGTGDPMLVLGTFAPSAAVAPAWAEFVAVFAALRAPQAPWPDELAALQRWYLPLLDRRHDDAGPRAADIGHLVRLAGGYPSRERFLTELALDPPAAASDESGPPGRDEDYLILSTIHSAKGQEWSAVSLLRVVDGCLPSDMATGSAAEVEEERRLLYVAMTRARHHLHLLVPQRFYVSQQTAFGDRHVYGSISRFLPPELHGLFDHVEPASAERGNARADAPATSVDLGARVRALWV